MVQWFQKSSVWNIPFARRRQYKKEVPEYAEQRTENKERAESGRSQKNQGSMESIGFKSRISEAMEENPSGHREDLPVQRQHRDENEVDFLFERKNYISPQKDSLLNHALRQDRQKTDGTTGGCG